ncbi:transporter [Vibrio cholerae]|nr:transporter [Vibrio cholerae]
MNFLPASIKQGQLQIAGKSCSLPQLASADHHTITLGIRPEHASLQPLANAIELKLDIQVVEPLGPNQLVHGKILGLESEQDFIAVTAEIPLDVHQTLPIWVAFDQLHLFDQQGKRLATQPHACSLNSKIATR